MQFLFDKALMTNRLSFELANKGHACFFTVAAWLFNFCLGFSNTLDTFSSKIESLQIMSRSFENQLRKVRKNGSQKQRKLALLYFVMATQVSAICFSFYQALGIFSTKMSCLAVRLFFFILPGNRN